MEAISRVLDAERAQLREERERNLAGLGSDAPDEATFGLVSLRLEHGGWRKTPTLSPTQPPNGFTILSTEDDRHVQLLCRAYEEAGADGRQLIRRFADLSLE